MNTFQLTCFIAVADCLNFARAAERLHITQPAVTQQIHSLEKELNVKLFQRTTRTVKLTREGKIFLDDARNIVNLTHRAKKRFEHPSNQEIRTLSLGFYSYTHLFMMPSPLKKLREQYPNIHPQLKVVPFQHLYRLLEENDVDAVIGFREPDSKKISAVYREWGKMPIFCVCSSSSPLCTHSVLSLEDIKKEKLILLDPAKAQSDIAHLQGQLLDGKSPRDFYFCETEAAAITLVQAGFGVALLPELFIPPALSLTRIPIADQQPVSFGIYYKSVQGNAPLKSLVQIIKTEQIPVLPIDISSSF